MEVGCIDVAIIEAAASKDYRRVPTYGVYGYSTINHKYI